jgi:hypothetical protein
MIKLISLVFTLSIPLLLTIVFIKELKKIDPDIEID